MTACVLLMLVNHGALAAEQTPPPLALSSEDLALLERGNVLIEELEYAGAEVTSITFKVDAPSTVVWAVIRGYENYSAALDALIQSDIYRRQESRYFVHFVARHWLIGEISYFVEHRFAESDGWASWTLDRAKTSDLAEAVGFWRVGFVDGQLLVTYAARARADAWWGGIGNGVDEDGLRAIADWIRQAAQALAGVAAPSQAFVFD